MSTMYNLPRPNFRQRFGEEEWRAWITAYRLRRNRGWWVTRRKFLYLAKQNADPRLDASLARWPCVEVTE